MSIMESLSRRTGPPSLERAGCAVRSAAPPTPTDVGYADGGPTDAELTALVRNGDVRAYGVLYERHRAAAYNLARQLTRSRTNADDFVSDAFASVLARLRAGKGPDSAFRAYLLTALRHAAYDKFRRDRKIELTAEVGEVSGVPVEAVSVAFTDTPVVRLERWLAGQAFCRLPVRWQAVLWHTTVEGHQPAEVAPEFGLTPNSVSALAYRAREGLCTAYLQVQVRESDVAMSCRATVVRLGPWTRAGLSNRERRQVDAHLEKCKGCRRRVCELAADNPRLVLQWDNPTLAAACAQATVR
jgi:RNA polymerase sigma factor (sigma-70 family)